MSEATEARAKRRAVDLLGTLASDLTPPGMGFAVFLFDPGARFPFAVWKAPRAEMLTMLKAWIADREQEPQ